MGSDPAADSDKQWESQATFGVLPGADHTIEGAAVHRNAGVMMFLPDATLAFGAWKIGGRLLGHSDEATGLFRGGRLADNSGELTQFRRADNTADFTQTGRRVSSVAATHDPKCFVAGTLVLAAADGSAVTATSIEDIKIGDWVWSRDEHTGEEGLKPVVTLFRNQADSLVHVTYTSGSAAATLTGTEEHPFWSVSRGSWVPMGELEAGETLALAGGLTATATAVRIERLATPVTVYNFEVADWHTYHVGTPDAGWVYVHNLCVPGKRMARALIHRGVSARDAIRLVKSGKLDGPGVYQFTSKTGQTYVGQSANMFRRIKQHLHPTKGRLLPGDVNSIQTFRPSKPGWLHRKIFEQQHMNHLAGQGIPLANSINSIAPVFWRSLGIRPPGE